MILSQYTCQINMYCWIFFHYLFWLNSFLPKFSDVNYFEKTGKDTFIPLNYRYGPVRINLFLWYYVYKYKLYFSRQFRNLFDEIYKWPYMSFCIINKSNCTCTMNLWHLTQFNGYWTLSQNIILTVMYHNIYKNKHCHIFHLYELNLFYSFWKMFSACVRWYMYCNSDINNDILHIGKYLPPFYFRSYALVVSGQI